MANTAKITKTTTDIMPGVGSPILAEQTAAGGATGNLPPLPVEAYASGAAPLRPQSLVREAVEMKADGQGGATGELITEGAEPIDVDALEDRIVERLDGRISDRFDGFERAFARVVADLGQRAASPVAPAPGGIPAVPASGPERLRSDDELIRLSPELTNADVRRLMELRGDADELERWAKAGVKPETHWIPTDDLHVIANGKRTILAAGVPVAVDQLDATLIKSLLDHADGPKLVRPGQRALAR